MWRRTTPGRRVSITSARPMASPGEPAIPSRTSGGASLGRRLRELTSLLFSEPAVDELADGADGIFRAFATRLDDQGRSFCSAEQKQPHDALRVHHLLVVAGGDLAREPGSELGELGRRSCVQA